MKIGELAHQTETPVATIRYYEREGLLPAAPRTRSNYRIYDAAHLRRLSFIRRCRELDMTLAEIRELLEILDDSNGDCAGADAVLDRHLDHVRSRLTELRQLERELSKLRAQCNESGLVHDCGILSGLEAPERSHERPDFSHGHPDDVHAR